MSIEYIGKICSGAGKSTKWMKKVLPELYPGTVNIKLDKEKPKINYLSSIETKYGICFISSCYINNLKVYLMLPPRATLNNYYIEVGHEEKIRDLLSLSDDDIVNVTFN